MTCAAAPSAVARGSPRRLPPTRPACTAPPTSARSTATPTCARGSSPRPSPGCSAGCPTTSGRVPRSAAATSRSSSRTRSHPRAMRSSRAKARSSSSRISARPMGRTSTTSCCAARARCTSATASASATARSPSTTAETTMLRVAPDHFSHTDTGRQRRANEDSYFARAPVFVVADGMGGAQAGEVASRIAVEAFERGLGDDGAASAEQLLAERVRAANARIHEMSQAERDLAGMGTTITAAHVGEHEVAIAHVGDSRAYRLRDGELERLTEDHSLVEEMRRRGQLTAQEADEHPQRSIITRALGPEPEVAVDTHSWRGQAGDVYLLCSDGLTSMLPEPQVGAILRGAATLTDAGHALIDAANHAGGRDNITV